MRIGMMGKFYPAPPGLTAEGRIEYLLKKSDSMGCRCLQLTVDLPEDKGKLQEVSDLAKSLDIELEARAPVDIFKMADDYKTVKEQFDSRIAEMRVLNSTIMRSAYNGNLQFAMSRFNKEIPLAEHMKQVASHLKLAAEIADSEGIIIAIENHCDFKAAEMAEIFDMVGSKNVGCATDTANFFTLFCDPADEIEIIAPYTLTTHIKDMQIVQETIEGRVPYYPVGCKFGEGHVDIPAILDVLAQKAPHPENLHLVMEIGWLPFAPDASQQEKDAYSTEVFHEGAVYLQKLIGV
jgi:sugar phosphate isomerase/epimerase